jgi:uncharacterized protein
MTSRRQFGLQPVFIDTSAYFALADTTETNHRQAQAILRRLAEEPWRLFTSNFVKTETHALMLTRLGRPMALRQLHGLAAGTTSVERVTEADEARALAIIEQYSDKNFSFTDAASFAVMNRLGITHAFHFDRNFREYGRFVDLAQQV